MCWIHEILPFISAPGRASLAAPNTEESSLSLWNCGPKALWVAWRLTWVTSPSSHSSISLTSAFTEEYPKKLVVSFVYNDCHWGTMKVSFQGEIPTNLSKCLHLQAIDLANNKLDVNIPIQRSSLPRLVYLSLEKNSGLGGTILPSLGNLSSVNSLYLGHCNFVGTFPYHLGRLSRLRFLSMGENHLQGEDPFPIYTASPPSVCLRSN